MTILHAQESFMCFQMTLIHLCSYALHLLTSPYTFLWLQVLRIVLFLGGALHSSSLNSF